MAKTKLSPELSSSAGVSKEWSKDVFPVMFRETFCLQVMKASMWCLLEVILIGAILLYSTVCYSCISHLLLPETVVSVSPLPSAQRFKKESARRNRIVAGEETGSACCHNRLFCARDHSRRCDSQKHAIKKEWFSFQVVIQYFEPTTETCLLVPWFRELGFAVLYGTLFLKVYR